MEIRKEVVMEKENEPVVEVLEEPMKEGRSYFNIGKKYATTGKGVCSTTFIFLYTEE